MYFSANSLRTEPNVGLHFAELTANRRIWGVQNDQMINMYQHAMTPGMLAANALGGFDNTFWAALDRQVVQLRGQETGMEIVDDLLLVQQTLPIGKTAAMYNIAGDIADDVSISIDGQAPYSFDHTEYTNDGDPIPVFTAGYGVNWRLAAGLAGNVDLVLDSQEAKLRKYNKRVVDYVLNGSTAINVAGKAGQGLKNHRHTYKINLGSGAGGANIDLTTATPAQLVEFFTKGAFGSALQANRLPNLTVLWVSSEIWRNLQQAYMIELGPQGVTMAGTVLDAVKKFIGVDTIRMTYALTGNEFLGYVRRSDYVRPLVGMTTGIVPLPRLMPQANYNFQIMGAMGIQVRADADGMTGVVYGANLG